MLKYCVNSIPDLTLSKYQVFADSGVDGMIEAQIQFIKQLHRVSLLGNVSIHFFFDYDPSRIEGQKLRIELIFNGLKQNDPYNDKLRKVINSSGISKYFNLCEESCNYSSTPQYANMAVMYKKERLLQTLLNNEERYFYVVPNWEMNEEARLYSLL